MDLGHRTFRAAATALLVAGAIGVAGTGGLSMALAADPVTNVPLTGTLVDEHGAPLGGVHLVISELLPPDGGLAGFQAITAADGSFAAGLYPWGTTAAPATLTIEAPAGERVEVAAGDCRETRGVAVDDTRQVALEASADAVAPVALVATTTLIGKVCAATATPPPGAGHGPDAAITPPPTDATATRLASATDRLGPALVIGFVVGLIAAAALLSSRPGARRRD